MSDSFRVPRHQALRDLFAYWQGQKGDAMAPPRAAIDPVAFRQLLPHVVMLDVIGSPPRFQVRLAGTGVVQDYGQEVTGRFVDELDFDDIDNTILADLAAVVVSAAPHSAEREFTKHDGRHLKYERLILPLSSDGRAVDRLLAGFVVEQSFLLDDARGTAGAASHPVSMAMLRGMSR